MFISSRPGGFRGTHSNARATMIAPPLTKGGPGGFRGTHRNAQHITIARGRGRLMKTERNCHGLGLRVFFESIALSGRRPAHS